MGSRSVRPQPGPRAEATDADPGIVRVAALLGVVPLLRECGIDPAHVLLSLGLDPGTLDHADSRIHYRMGGQLLQHCARITDCAHFGLLVGQQATIASLGILGELMRRSPTVHSALRGLLLHLHLQTRGGVPTHRVEGENATFGYAIYQRDMPGTAHAYDLVMAFEFNILRALCGAPWLPREVSFSHAKPEDLGPYRQFFRSPLRFNADRSEIVFNKTWLEHALPGHDVEAHRRLQCELATQLLLAPDDWAEQVRRALRTMIPSGCGSEAQIGDLLSVPTRTLRRLLGVQGTSFRELLEDVRYEIARQLLKDSDMSTAEIAEALDYFDACAFTRAFRRWTDSPPAAWRAMNRSATGRRELS
jgi:AraC-like DNA-binding protein